MYTQPLVSINLPAYPNIPHGDPFEEGMKIYNALKLLQQIISLFGYPVILEGADASGVQISTAAFNNAITKLVSSGRSTLFIPEGDYKVDGAINSTTTGIRIVGNGRENTRIHQITLNSKIINSTGLFFELQGISLIYDGGTPVAGATAIYTEGSYSLVSEVLVLNGYIGWHIKTGVAIRGRDFELLDYEFAGLQVEGNNDAYITRFIINAGNATRGTAGGLRLINKCEAFVASQGEVLQGVFGLYTDCAVFGAGTRPAYCKFTDVYFDSSANTTAYINKIVLSEFVSCWFSGGRSGGGAPGAICDTTNQITFSVCTFTNNGSHGVALLATAVATSILGCKAEGNSVTAGVNVAHGIFVSPDTDDFIIANNTCKNGLLGGTQGYGIVVGVGASDNYQIINNPLQGNGIAGLLDGGNGILARVEGNMGYNPLGIVAIVVGASPFTYIAGHTPETVYIDGGTVTAISTGGAVVFAASPATIELGPNEAVTVTYAVVPVMNSRVH